MPTGDVALASMAGMATRPGADGFLQDGDGSALSRVSCSPEAKTGGLVLVGPAKHAQHVQVKVYRTSLEHFAVVYPQKKACRPLGFVNLRHTVVARLPSAGEKVHLAVAGRAGRPQRQQQAHAAAVCLPRQYQHLAGFVVRSRQCDSPHTLTFLAENAKEVESWLAAFDPARAAPAGLGALRAQPILEEGDEL